MGYADDIERFRRKVEADSRQIFRNLEEDVFDSITEGSEVTGSKGQPVRTGELRDSWRIESAGDGTTVVYTDKEYAPKIERGRWTRRESKGGGSRSLALTIAGWRRLVAEAVRKLRGI